jgi:hypothetical protein
MQFANHCLDFKDDEYHERATTTQIISLYLAPGFAIFFYLAVCIWVGIK